MRGSKSGIFSFDDAGIPISENRSSPILAIINVLLNKPVIFAAWVEMDAPMILVGYQLVKVLIILDQGYSYLRSILKVGMGREIWEYRSVLRTVDQ